MTESELDNIAELLVLRCEVDNRGTARYYDTDNQLHRVHGPALIYSDGSQEWYRNGQLHRLDGPAVIYIGGTKLWYVNGLRHRLDGPAVEYENGSEIWYKNGEFIRYGRR